MKRILIAIAASALVASAANAAFDVTADVDGTSYGLGDNVTVNIQLTTQGTHNVGVLGTLEYSVDWDPAVFVVANSDIPNNFGTASQSPILTGLNGSTTPACFNTADSCVTVSQINPNFAPLGVDGIVNASLVLTVIGGVGSALSDVLTIGIPTGTEIASSITIGANYGAASIVPEPTTAVLLGLGLVGLGVAGRRR